MHPSLAVFSDHWPLLGVYKWQQEGPKRKRCKTAKPRLKPIDNPVMANCFADFIDQRIDEKFSLATFSECIYYSHKCALEASGAPAVQTSAQELAVLSHRVQLELDHTSEPAEKASILREASKRRKAIIKAQLHDGFVRSALTLPRFDKSKHSKKVVPLKIGEESTFCTKRWGGV